MGSHLGIALQAGVAARSHRRHDTDYVQHTEWLDGHDHTSSQHPPDTTPRRKDSCHSGQSDRSNRSSVIDTLPKGRGEALLHIASRHNRKDMVLREIRNGADVNVQTTNLDTPLHIACRRGHVEITQTLLANGAELEVRNLNGETPLEVAKSKSHLHTVRLLVLQGTFVGRGTRQAIADGIRLLS
ncbi:uncharacterized protein RCC_11415 [Ramularia collo-cygni]|uniref:Uncharacterized protein n=1 Tax=Ramularia collo-cygni TaxID=112498 RepID=A0A2D3VLN2_9PEZI|nr:uncharacterized protein RCC_11415 [Ramularia collo-cygni]CZT25746.1 uncharacterized protein RCC_11415 [Ramularia collo-cygni]